MGAELRPLETGGGYKRSGDVPLLLSQVFVHLSSLEHSILWSRSILNARCRICRRKGDADNMLLCDGCDRGHHTHCLRPRLKVHPRPPEPLAASPN